MENLRSTHLQLSFCFKLRIWTPKWRLRVESISIIFPLLHFLVQSQGHYNTFVISIDLIIKAINFLLSICSYVFTWIVDYYNVNSDLFDERNGPDHITFKAADELMILDGVQSGILDPQHTEGIE